MTASICASLSDLTAVCCASHMSFPLPCVKQSVRVPTKSVERKDSGARDRRRAGLSTPSPSCRLALLRDLRTLGGNVPMSAERAARGVGVNGQRHHRITDVTLESQNHRTRLEHKPRFHFLNNKPLASLRHGMSPSAGAGVGTRKSRPNEYAPGGAPLTDLSEKSTVRAGRPENLHGRAIQPTPQGQNLIEYA
jgi:hypothetical protein